MEANANPQPFLPERGADGRPFVEVAVLMRREHIGNRWQPWRWVLADVVPMAPGFGAGAKRLLQTDTEERWLHAPYRVALYRDDAEGYYLNASAPAPCWFVLWRMDEPTADAPDPIARPAAVSLSYHDAGRWLDAQETVEQVPAPAPIVDWMRAFADDHYVPEPKKRKRPESFKALQDRFGNPASVSTDKKFGGPAHG